MFDSFCDIVVVLLPLKAQVRKGKYFHKVWVMHPLFVILLRFQGHFDKVTTTDGIEHNSVALCEPIIAVVGVKPVIIWL